MFALPDSGYTLCLLACLAFAVWDLLPLGNVLLMLLVAAPLLNWFGVFS